MGLFDFLTTRKQSVDYGFTPRSSEESTAYQQTADFNKGLTDSAGAPTFDAVKGIAEGSKAFTSGAFLDPNDPVNKGFVEATLRPLQQQFKEQTVPGLEGYLAKSGATGGSRGTDLIRQAYRDFEQVLGDTSSKALQTIGQTRVAGYAYGSNSVLDIIKQIQAGNAAQFAMAPHAVQTGSKSVGSTLDAVSQMFGIAQQAVDLGSSAYSGMKMPALLG